MSTLFILLSGYSLLGRAINRRLRGDAFVKYVHAGLLCVGTLLLIQAIHHP